MKQNILLAAAMSLGLSTACKSTHSSTNDVQAFEQEAGIFENYIDRIYLTYRDQTPNVREGEAGPGSFESQLVIPLDNQKGDEAVGVKYSFPYLKDNAPPLFSEKTAGASNPLDVQVVFCKDEKYYSYFRERLRNQGNDFDLPMVNQPAANEANGFSSDFHQTCRGWPCLPFNERMRLADFPLGDGSTDIEHKCEVIADGGSFSSDFESFAKRGEIYADKSLAPQLGAWVDVGMSAMTCATFVAGPIMAWTMKAGEALVESSVNAGQWSQAASAVGLQLVNASNQAQQAGLAIANVFRMIHIFGAGADVRFLEFFAPWMRFSGSVVALLRPVFVEMTTRLIKAVAVNAGIKVGYELMVQVIEDANSQLLFERLNIEPAKRDAILAQARSTTPVDQASYTALIAKLEGLASLEEVEMLRRKVNSPEIMALVRQANEHIIKPEYIVEFALQAATLIFPIASCADFVYDSLEIDDKFKKAANLKNFLASVDGTRKDTEAYLLATQPIFAHLKAEVEAHPGDMRHFTRYQSMLMPQVIYAFNKILQSEYFRNGRHVTNLFRPHAALGELRDALKEVEKSAPEVALVMNVAVAGAILDSAVGSDLLMQLMRAGLKASALRAAATIP